MTNTDKLKAAIQKSGYRKRYIAQQLGLTYQGLQNKVENRKEFKASEIAKLSELLQLTVPERFDIFFDEAVDR